MKKSIILLVFLSLTVFGFAFEQGTKSIGGSVEFSATNYIGDSPTGYSLTITPALSYFVIENLAIELSPGYYVSWADGYDTRTGYSIGLGMRYFIKKFYLGGSYQYGKYGFKGQKSSSQSMTLAAGHLFPMAKNIFFDVGIRYNKGLGQIKSPYGNHDNDMSSFSTRAGVVIYFK